MKAEYKMHVNSVKREVQEMIVDLMSKIETMNCEGVVSACDNIIEELNVIKELYTDESLL
jgi:aspartate/glutamate racemase